MANNSSSITLLNSLEFARKYVYNRQLSLGDFKEPLITASNLVKQVILSPPFRWRFNRSITGFYTTPSVQDYLLGNWSASTLLGASFFVIDSNGNSQKVTTAGTTGAALPAWNATLGGTTTDNTVTWTNQGPIPNASSTYTFGWIENCTVKDPGTSKWMELSPKIDLALDSSTARPQNIAAELDPLNGSQLFRLMPVPDKVYPVAITLQQKAGLFTSLNQTWSPLPDEYSYIYQWGLLAEIFLFADDARATWASQKFVSHLLGANQGLSDTERNVFLQNWQAVTGNPIEKQIQLQQGNQARGGY